MACRATAANAPQALLITSALSSIYWLSQTRFDEGASLMANQWEQVRSRILGLTIQVKPKFAKWKNWI